jgi:hypothetical protein
MAITPSGYSKDSTGPQSRMWRLSLSGACRTQRRHRYGLLGAGATEGARTSLARKQPDPIPSNPRASPRSIRSEWISGAKRPIRQIVRAALGVSGPNSKILFACMPRVCPAAASGAVAYLVNHWRCRIAWLVTRKCSPENKFSAFKDPSQARKVVYPLFEIPLIVLLNGWGRGFLVVERRARQKLDFLRPLQRVENGIPAHGANNNMMARSAGLALFRMLHNRVKNPHERERDVVASGGKAEVVDYSHGKSSPLVDARSRLCY